MPGWCDPAAQCKKNAVLPAALTMLLSPLSTVPTSSATNSANSWKPGVGGCDGGAGRGGFSCSCKRGVEARAQGSARVQPSRPAAGAVLGRGDARGASRLHSRYSHSRLQATRCLVLLTKCYPPVMLMMYDTVSSRLCVLPTAWSSRRRPKHRRGASGVGLKPGR